MEQKMTFDQYIRMRERNADFARALARTNLALRCWERSEMWDEICAAQSMKIMWLLDNHILQAFYKRCGIDVLPLSIGGMYGYVRKVCIHPHNCKQVKEEKELSLLATSSGRVDGDYPGPKIILSKELEAGANPIGLLERATLAAVGGWPSKCNSKHTLLKKALGTTDDLIIGETDEAISFGWIPADAGVERCQATTHLIEKLCHMAKTVKRVNATEHAVTNEKYSFRCFLLRLGFIGPQYKVDRKVLLHNFTGSAAFKNGKAKKDLQIEQSAYEA